MQGRIICHISNQYQVKGKEAIYMCQARGKLKQDEISPVVGDQVVFALINEQEKLGIIEEILPRENFIKRPKLANISQIILVISSKMPKPDLLMLDKQLAFAEYNHIKPIIVINKIDLNQEVSQEIEKLYSKMGYQVIKTNAKTKEGMEELKEILKGKISALSGNSGVGKSTMINRLFQKEMTEEGNISAKNKKGKNTTTSVCLYELEKDTYLADTPGFSTFSIYEIPANELATYFIEFKGEIQKCEYVGCRHQKEEDCGIKKAVQLGNIAQERYERYCKIYEEIKDKEEHKW